MKKVLTKITIIVLAVLNILVFYRVKKIEQANSTLENNINNYLDLKEKTELYNNILNNANLLEKNVQELETEKNKVENEIIDLTLEINNIQENIKKLN